MISEIPSLNDYPTLPKDITRAITSREYTKLVKDSPVKILDTCETIPGLYDVYLIKENHAAACEVLG